MGADIPVLNDEVSEDISSIFPEQFDDIFVKIYQLNKNYLNIIERRKVSEKLHKIYQDASSAKELLELISNSNNIEDFLKYRESHILNFRYGITPLCMFSHDLKKVRLLLDLGTSPLSIYNNELGYFYPIIRHTKAVELLKILESYDDNRNIYYHTDFEGRNLLHHAFMHKINDIIEYVKNNETLSEILNVKDFLGNLPIHYLLDL